MALNLDCGDVRERFGDVLEEEQTGQVYDVAAGIFRVLAGKKVVVSRDFVGSSPDQRAVRCTSKVSDAESAACCESKSSRYSRYPGHI